MDAERATAAGRCVITLSGGIEIAHDDVGSGVPVLFLHGFPLDRTIWLPQLNAMVDLCRCIAPDLRGFGESTVRGPYSMDQYADDAVLLLSALDIERAVIAGLSMGGYIAFAMWRRHPQRIRALVLADTRAGADSEEARAKRRDLIELARTRGSGAVAAGQIQAVLGATTRERNTDVVDAVHAIMNSAPEEGIVGALDAMMARPDSTPLLPTINVPVLIVTGAEDTLTPPEEGRRMHEAIAGSSFQTIPEAGHLSNYERPAAFNHVLGEFLGSLRYA